jgi:hypothetical protein
LGRFTHIPHAKNFFYEQTTHQKCDTPQSHTPLRGNWLETFEIDRQISSISWGPNQITPRSVDPHKWATILKGEGIAQKDIKLREGGEHVEAGDGPYQRNGKVLQKFKDLNRDKESDPPARTL